MIKNKTLEQLQSCITDGETCVINLTANWCSDCTDQAENMAAFRHQLTNKVTACYSLVVQDEKNIYLSAEHQAFTDGLGGHGFPRTVLFINGKAVDTKNVEIISVAQLNELGLQFLQQL